MKRLHLVVLVLTAALLSTVTFFANPTPAKALTVTGLSITLGCSSYSYSSYTFTFDRNNTSSSESYYIEITDGSGKVLRRFDATFALGSITDGAGTIPYTQGLPNYNPLFYRIVSKAGNGLGEQVAYTAVGTCPGLPLGSLAGRAIPDGFVLRTIACDVAVYNLPGGSPVGDNRIIAGQTWYVNPTPAKSASGENWTEIFVSGIIDGFIPTRCVK